MYILGLYCEYHMIYFCKLWSLWIWWCWKYVVIWYWSFMYNFLLPSMCCGHICNSVTYMLCFWFWMFSMCLDCVAYVMRHNSIFYMWKMLKLQERFCSFGVIKIGKKLIINKIEKYGGINGVSLICSSHIKQLSNSSTSVRLVRSGSLQSSFDMPSIDWCCSLPLQHSRWNTTGQIEEVNILLEW